MDNNNIVIEEGKTKFEKWRVIEKDIEKSRKYNRTMYVCECDCGAIQSVALHDLKTKRSRGCPKCMRSGTNSSSFKDKTGYIYGKYKVLGFDHMEQKAKQNKSYWKCLNTLTGEEVVLSEDTFYTILHREKELDKMIGLDNTSKEKKVPFTFINNN